MTASPFEEWEIAHICSTSRKSIIHCTNNFFLFFTLNKVTGKSYYRETMEELSGMDIVYRVLIPSDPLASDKMKNQTGREFLDEVDRTAAEVCGSVENVREVVKEWRLCTRDEVVAEMCYKTLIAVYKKLRENGYSRADLIR